MIRRLGHEAPHQDEGDGHDDRRSPRTASATRGCRRSGRWPRCPTPPPTPRTADTRPIATLWRSGGNSSRMIAKLSGKTAPPTPWTARNTISEAMFHAKIAPIEPDQEDREGDDHQLHLAVLVAQPADDRRRHRAREQVGGDGPGDPGPRGVQVVLKARQRRDQEGLHQGERHRGGHQARQGQPQRLGGVRVARAAHAGAGPEAGSRSMTRRGARRAGRARPRRAPRRRAPRWPSTTAMPRRRGVPPAGGQAHARRPPVVRVRVALDRGRRGPAGRSCGTCVGGLHAAGARASSAWVSPSSSLSDAAPPGSAPRGRRRSAPRRRWCAAAGRPRRAGAPAARRAPWGTRSRRPRRDIT